MEKLLEIKPAEAKEPILIETTEVEYEGGGVVTSGRR